MGKYSVECSNEKERGREIERFGLQSVLEIIFMEGEEGKIEMFGLR